MYPLTYLAYFDIFFRMKHHIKITFSGCSNEQKDILIATLSDIGFDGFEEGPDFLAAYAEEGGYNTTELDAIAADLSISYSTEHLAEKNWNEAWEQSFEPVLVDDFCVIRASFHAPVSGVAYDVIITPKMSFGTGHHATTFMMVKWMKTLDHHEKVVLDFGTGTGVLAILAEKMGAAAVQAIDNDEWSIENARENIETNGSQKISLARADKLAFTQQFHIILANINRNVLLANMDALKQHLAVGGVLILSGLLTGDRAAIEGSANQHKLKITGELEKNGWISLQLTHY